MLTWLHESGWRDRLRWWWWSFIGARRFRARYADGTFSRPTSAANADWLAGRHGGVVVMLDNDTGER